MWLSIALLLGLPSRDGEASPQQGTCKQNKKASVTDCTAGTANASGPAEQGVTKSLAVVNELGKSVTFTDEVWRKLPRKNVEAKDHSGALAVYEGVVLASVLAEAGVKLGKDLRGPRLALTLLVEAEDGFRVAFSLAEIDPDMTDRVVLLADRKDGKALDAREGPLRLVVPQDKRHSRWVRQVLRIRVQGSTPNAAKPEKP
jgi:hypothetical protein